MLGNRDSIVGSSNTVFAYGLCDKKMEILIGITVQKLSGNYLMKPLALDMIKRLLACAVPNAVYS
jgi:hypothetical protein